MELSNFQDLTIVIPMLNEQASAHDVVRRLVDSFGQTERNLTIVCVNDGSTDKTQEVLGSLAATYPEVEIRSHARRLGYGCAIRTGLSSATTDLVGWMDGDGQYEPTDLHHLIDAIESGAAGAIGIRTKRADGPHRRVLGRAGSVLASIICRHRLHDADAGLKVFVRSHVTVDELRSHGGFISTEVLRKVLVSGNVAQVPISHLSREQGKQTGASARVLWGMIVDFSRVLNADLR